MPRDQEVPKGPDDWHLDALITGDGFIIERAATDGQVSKAGNSMFQGNDHLSVDSK